MSSRRAADLETLIARVARAVRERSIEFMVVGGQAVLLHGVPRLTQDIDITLAIAPDEAGLILDLCASLPLRPLPEDPERFARHRYVLPALDVQTGIRVDFIFSTIPYERQAIRRARPVRLGGADVPFASAEDLILYKLFAGRPRDTEDVQGIVRRKGSELDWEYVEAWAREFSGIPGREGLPDQVRELRGLGSAD